MMSEREEDSTTRNDSCKFKVYSKRDRNPVFLTEFTNGRVTSEGTSKLQFQCLKSKDGSQLLTANNGRLNYTGVASDPDSPLSYFVGVRNKKTGKMKLYDACYFRMKPDINVKASSTLVAADKGSYVEKISALNEKFGSKAKQRAMTSNRDNAVNTAASDFSNFLEGNEFEPSTNSRNGQLDYLPTANKEAKTPSEVFDISTIIPPSLDSALAEKVTELSNASNEEIVAIKSKFCTFVNSQFDSNDIDISVDILKSKYLIYYNYLVIFQHLKYEDIRKKIPTRDIPQPFLGLMLLNYTLTTAGNRHTLPQKCKDKLLAHLLVLGLFFNNFTVNLHSIAVDLHNVKIEKLAQISHALGCHVSIHSSNDEQLKFAVLKLPLYVATIKPSKRK